MKKLKISRLTPDSRYLQTVALNSYFNVNHEATQLYFFVPWLLLCTNRKMNKPMLSTFRLAQINERVFHELNIRCRPFPVLKVAENAAATFMLQQRKQYHSLLSCDKRKLSYHFFSTAFFPFFPLL